MSASAGNLVGAGAGNLLDICENGLASPGGGNYQLQNKVGRRR